MNRKISLVLIVSLVVLMIVGCSAPAEEASMEYDYPAETPAEEPAAEAASKSDDSGVYTNGSGPNEDLFNFGNLKIIKNGSMTVETLEFDHVMENLEKQIKHYNGYIESQYVKSGTYYNKNLRNANMRVRIPSENFELMFKSLGELGHIVDQNQSAQDVSEEYFDTEARVETLLVQEERLLEFLKKSETLEDTVMLERELSNTRYEIEKYTGSLRKMDSLVAYSTINIAIREVEEIKALEPVKTVSFGERLSFAFKDGIDSFISGIQSFTLMIARNFIGLIFWIIIIIVGVRFFNKWRANQNVDLEKLKPKE